MKIACEGNGNSLSLTFTLEDGDRTHAPARARGFGHWEEFRPDDLTRGFRLARPTCQFEFPAGWRLSEVHPDLLGLATAFLVLPFARSQVRVPYPVSSSFAAAFKLATDRDIVPVDGRLDPRRSPVDPPSLLMYSGGVDSTAALQVLPQATVPIHLAALSPRAVAWDAEPRTAALRACAEIRSGGQSVEIVESDLKGIVEPAGFPTHQAVASSALLLADRLQGGAIAFGSIMCSTYGVGDRPWRFVDPMSRGGWQMRASLYDAAGVAYAAPVAGLTEVGTARVATAGPLVSFAQSCDHGGPTRPCMACVKCFRKTLVKMALADDFSDEHLLERMASIPSIREHLCRVPIHHESVYAWALGQYDGSSALLRAFQRRTRNDDSDFRWAERWFAPSLALLPRALRSSVADRVTSYAEPMDDRDEAALRSFDLGSLGNDQAVLHRAAELRRTIGHPTMSQLTRGLVRRVRRRVFS